MSSPPPWFLYWSLVSLTGCLLRAPASAVWALLGSQSVGCGRGLPGKVEALRTNDLLRIFVPCAIQASEAAALGSRASGDKGYRVFGRLSEALHILR